MFDSNVLYKLRIGVTACMCWFDNDTMHIVFFKCKILYILYIINFLCISK